MRSSQHSVVGCGTVESSRITQEFRRKLKLITCFLLVLACLGLFFCFLEDVGELVQDYAATSNTRRLHTYIRFFFCINWIRSLRVPLPKIDLLRHSVLYVLMGLLRTDVKSETVVKRGVEKLLFQSSRKSFEVAHNYSLIMCLYIIHI
jgi:hypothetical protein